MRKVRKRYLLITYDPRKFTVESLKGLILSSCSSDSKEVSHVRRISPALKSGLAVFSVPHTSVPMIRQSLTPSGPGPCLVVSSGTLEGLRRKMRARGIQKGLSEAHPI